MKIKNIFKSNWTRWEPVHVYTHDWHSFIILSKLNKKSGLVKFRTIQINSKFGGMIESPKEIDFKNSFSHLLKTPA